MAIGRTARGTNSFHDLGQATQTLTISVTVGATGSALFVGFTYIGGDDVTSVTWNSVNLSRLIQKGTSNGGGLMSESWYLANATAATANMVITFANNGFNGWPTNAAAFATEITGCTTAPFDVSASATGSGTSPSSGATTTLGQAVDLAIGVIVTNGAATDTAGSWSNSYSAGVRIDCSGNAPTISEGYFVTGNNTGQTAAKTGITSRAWQAQVLTFKQLNTVTVNLGAGSATATGRATTAAMGGISAALDKGVATGTGRAVTDSLGGITASLGAGSAASAGYGLVEFSARYYVNPGTANVDSVAPQTMQEAASIGITSKGKPYFCLRTNNTGHHPNIGENEFIITFAINSVTQLSDPDELHALATLYGPGDRPNFTIGVSPSRRLIVREAAATAPLQYRITETPTGVIPFDGSFHTIQYYRGGLSPVDVRDLIVDGATVVEEYGPINANGGGDSQMMFFNDTYGASRINGTIRYFEFDPDGTNPIRWMFNEGSGSTVHAEEFDFLSNSWLPLPCPTTDYPGADLDVSAAWFDPREFANPPLWGGVPQGSTNGAFNWWVNTAYGRVAPNDATYTGLGGADVGYKRGLPFQGNYTSLHPKTDFTR